MDLGLDSRLPGFPGLPGFPNTVRILLWETSREAQTPLGLGILAGQKDRVLERVEVQNVPWDHPARVHPGTHTADNGMCRTAGVQGRVVLGRVVYWAGYTRVHQGTPWQAG